MPAYTVADSTFPICWSVLKFIPFSGRINLAGSTDLATVDEE
jgi:hypothetical protein